MSRKALRDFYRLQQEVAAQEPPQETENSHTTEPFDSEKFIEAATNSDLVDLVKSYRTLLSEKQVLDSDQKALIYNNYKNLIEASEKLEGIDHHSSITVGSVSQGLEKIANAAAVSQRKPLAGANFKELQSAYLEKYGPLSN